MMSKSSWLFKALLGSIERYQTATGSGSNQDACWTIYNGKGIKRTSLIYSDSRQILHFDLNQKIKKVMNAMKLLFKFYLGMPYQLSHAIWSVWWSRFRQYAHWSQFTEVWTLTDSASGCQTALCWVIIWSFFIFCVKNKVAVKGCRNSCALVCLCTQLRGNVALMVVWGFIVVLFFKPVNLNCR